MGNGIQQKIGECHMKFPCSENCISYAMCLSLVVNVKGYDPKWLILLGRCELFKDYYMQFFKNKDRIFFEIQSFWKQ